MTDNTAQRQTPRAPLRRHGGFTLAEVVAALGIMTILLGAIGSALIVAIRALPNGSSPLEAVARGGSALEQIASELHTATAVAAASDKVIEFSVPDRSGDGAPESIRYAWSGTAGDPLTRSYNGGAATDFVPGVHDFDLAYRLVTHSEERPVDTESGETLLISYDATSNLYDFTVMEDEEPGQFFRPTLPEGAKAWSVTRFKIMASQAGYIYTGVVTVQLRTAGADGRPTGTVLQAFTMLESSLSGSSTWREFAVTGASGLVPGQGLCLWVRHDQGTYACDIVYRSGAPAGANSFAVVSLDGGSSWLIYPNDSMLYYVYGTVTAPTQQVVEVTFLAAVNIAIQPSAQASSRVETAVNVLNQPEVSN